MSGDPSRARAAAVLPYLAAALAALELTAPLLTRPADWSSHSDWFFITAPLAAARNTLLEHGQLPLWNPFTYGGITAIGYLRNAYLSPLFAFVLLFGVFPGLKLKIALTTVLGALGMVWLGRRLGMSAAGAALAALVFTGSSTTWLWLYCGAPQYLSIWLLPWIYGHFRELARGRAPVRGRTTVWTALLLVAMHLEGACYYLMFTLFLLGWTAVAWALRRRSTAPLAAVAAVGVLFALLAALKLLPVLETAVKYPRRVAHDIEYVSARSVLVDGLAGRDQDPERPHFGPADRERAAALGKVPWAWWEYGAYLGAVPLLLAVLGAPFLFRRHPDLVLGLGFFLWLTLGHAAPVDLWAWIHLLPGYDQLQFPTRWVILVVFHAALLAGLGLTELGAWIETRLAASRGAARAAPAAAAIAAALAGLAWLDLRAVSRPIVARVFDLPARPIVAGAYRQTARIVRAGGIINSSYILVEAGLGAIVTQVDVPIPRSAIASESPAYRGEAFVAGGEAAGAAGAADLADLAPARVARFTPNRVEVELGGSARGRLVLNQNHDDGWRAEVDGEARPTAPFRGLLRPDLLRPSYSDEDFSDVYLRDSIPHKYANGLVAVDVRPGDRHVVFRYDPWTFRWGLALSAATGAVLIGAGIAARRRRAPAPSPSEDRRGGSRPALAVVLLAALALTEAVAIARIRVRYAGWQERLARDGAEARARSGAALDPGIPRP